MDPSAREKHEKTVIGRKFGAHMSIAGGCDRAVWAAHAIPFRTVQLFTKNNNRWDGVPLTEARMPRRFVRRWARQGSWTPWPTPLT